MRVLFDSIHAAFHNPKTRVYGVAQGVIWALIVASIGLLVTEAMLPVDSPLVALLGTIDRGLLLVFAVEYALRVLSYRSQTLTVFRHPPIGRVRTHLLSRLSFMLRPVMLVDLLAILALFPELRGLRALRLLRLLRTSRVFRYRNPFAIVVRTLEENALLFAFAFSVLGVMTVLGGLSFYLIEARFNPEMSTVFDGIWWALVTLTTVGYGDITPATTLGRIIGGVTMIGGMFTLALFAGIVGSGLVRGMMSIREEQFRMSDHVNHIVVCGYDESTHLLLGALKQELNLNESPVVLFDDHERPHDLPPDFIWVQGDPSKQSELDKVRLTHAAAVIVSGERDTTPQIADARTILIAFTIRRYLQEHADAIRQRRNRLYVVAEILDSENVDHARTAGADEVIETRRIGYSMIAHAVGYHGTADAMSRVLISGRHNVYIGRIPEPFDTETPFGELMERLRLSERGGLVIGLRPEGGKETLNPPKSRMVEPGTLLLYLAETQLLEPPD